MRGSLYRLSAEQTPQDEKAEYLRSIEPTWSGTLAYRGHVSAELLKQKHPGHQALYSAKIVSVVLQILWTVSLTRLQVVREGQGEKS